MLFKLKRLIIICALIHIGCSRTYIIPGYSQVSDADLHPIIISDKVGETIDTLERKQFNLFPIVEDYESAIVYPIGKDDPEYKSGYVVEITKTDGKKYRSVNRDPRGIMILQEYFASYEYIKQMKNYFKIKWHIIGYDDLDIPITQEEMGWYKCRKNTYSLASVGCLSGCGLGLGIGLSTFDWFYGGNNESNNVALIAVSLGSFGCIGGATIGGAKDNKLVINAIKAGRKLREVE